MWSADIPEVGTTAVHDEDVAPCCFTAGHVVGGVKDVVGERGVVDHIVGRARRGFLGAGVPWVAGAVPDGPNVAVVASGVVPPSAVGEFSWSVVVHGRLQPRYRVVVTSTRHPEGKLTWLLSDPEFTTEFVDGELVVLISSRGGLNDEQIAREARKRTQVLAPVRIDRSDDFGREAPRDPFVFTSRHQLHEGGRLVFTNDLDGVWTIAAVGDADEDRLLAWLAKNPDHVEWVHAGGKIITVELVSVTGVDGTYTCPGNYNHNVHTGIWVVPDGDHWPRCGDCRQPWPCQTHRQATSAAYSDMMERKRCFRCGKSDGNQHVFKRADGFPERRSYHTRKGACLNAAVKWANEYGWEMIENRYGGRTFRRTPVAG